MGKQLWCVLGMAAACMVQAQVTAGQTDTFNADLLAWQGANATWMSGGGPGGASDAFMQLHSVAGGGPSSRMAGYNNLQWAGNFTGAGVGSISVDFNDSGATSLVMRLVFFDASTSTQWESLSTASLAAGSGWQHFTFSLNPSNFTQVEGTTSFADTLSSVNRMMFRHNVNPSSGGDLVVATLGVDNVHANPVPEPATLCALGLGLPWLLKRRRK